MIRNILCIGAGYVSGPTMVMIAYKCPQYKATVVDINPERIAQWNLDEFPISTAKKCEKDRPPCHCGRIIHGCFPRLFHRIHKKCVKSIFCKQKDIALLLT